MTEEGRILFLQALKQRVYHKWTKARLLFEEAARLGSGEACWYLFTTDYWSGSCYVGADPKEDEEDDDDDDDEKQGGYDEKKIFGYLAQGAQLDHTLCIALHQVLVSDPDWVTLPKPPNLDVEIIWWDMFPDYGDSKRTINSLEMAGLKKAAEKAVLIHDAWPVSCYFKYVTHRYDRMKFVDPYLIGHALFLFETDDSVSPSFRSKTTQLYQHFNYQHVVEENYFRLDEHSLTVVRCILGQMMRRFLIKGGKRYVRVYETFKRRADAAVLAWMGCFRRKALPGLSRDTATLIAKMMADPLKWIL